MMWEGPIKGKVPIPFLKDYGGIPIEAIDYYREHLDIGSSFTLTRIDPKASKAKQRRTIQTITIIDKKQRFAITDDANHAISYIDLMIETGWWIKHKEEVFKWMSESNT